METTKHQLCKNTDCVKNKDQEYTDKCKICDGYFADDGLNDILLIEESPNNRNASCELCKNTRGIVQMKGTGQYICQNSCDESVDESENENESIGEYDDEEIAYLNTLDVKEKQAFHIAKSHLGNTFHLKKSNGFIDWKKSLS